MQLKKETINHYTITHAEHKEFKASLKMNPRDNMVVARITDLPPRNESQTKLTKAFEAYLQENVGGKILLQLPEALSSTLPAQESSAHLQYVDKDTLTDRMKLIAKKSKVINILNRFNDDEAKEGKYVLLKNPEDYKELYGEYDQFQKDNASFVTSQKIEAGLYSPIAAKKKIDNEFVNTIAIYDPQKKKFVAGIHLFIHDDLAYISDFIVNKDETNQGVAQTLLLLAFQEMKKDNLKGIWFIAGGDGQTPKGAHLYGKILGTQPLDSSLQKMLGVRPIFGTPKELLCTAGNRNPNTGISLDEAHLLKDSFIATIGQTNTETLSTTEKEIEKNSSTIAPRTERTPTTTAF